MSLPLLALVQPDEPEAPKSARLFCVATRLAELLGRAQPVHRQDLKRLMEETFSSSDAGGAWSMRDAYDALEAAQVLHLKSSADPAGLTLAGEGAIASLRGFERALPTQSYRSEHQVEMQQFSTTISLSWLAALAARMNPDDHVLEPSAGTGMLAVHGLRAGASLTLNERDPDRAALLCKLLERPVMTHDAEFINDLLPIGVTPTVVLINPPFSRSEGRGKDRFAGARHLRSALLRLAPGGRCVAIMPPSFAADGTAATGYTMVCETVVPRVEITILGNPYAKHGTSIAVRMLVFDKGWTGVTERQTAQTIEAAEAIARAVPARLSTPEPLPPAPAVLPQRPRKPALSVPSAIFGGLQKRMLAAPDRIAADSSVRPLVYAVRETPLAAGDPVGHYAPGVQRASRSTVRGLIRTNWLNRLPWHRCRRRPLIDPCCRTTPLQHCPTPSSKPSSMQARLVSATSRAFSRPTRRATNCARIPRAPSTAPASSSPTAPGLAKVGKAQESSSTNGTAVAAALCGFRAVRP
jgi:hypothetical protein